MVISKMAAVLKHWREAATLILICRTTGTPKVVNPPNSSKLKRNFDYRVLMLKRSAKSKFMPSAYVFPGGTASDSDFSAEWRGLFEKSGIDLSKWPTALSCTTKNIQKISPMLTRQRDPEFSTIPADIAFRISAIRETFEESGVLLVRSTESDQLTNAVDKFTQKLPVTASLCGKLAEETLLTWRKRVEKDASEFIKLCKENSFLPDIWSLYSWCNWLTPVKELRSEARQARRFDTIFYLSILDEMPKFVKHDSGETVHTQWFTPAEVLQNFRAKQLWVAPPQLYELSRLVQFATAEKVADFANRRADYHIERFMPVTVGTTDIKLDVFPGDVFYPEEPDLVGTKEGLKREETLAALNKQSPKNRIELHGMFDLRIMCDIDMKPEHISPLTDNELAVLDTDKQIAKL